MPFPVSTCFSCCSWLWQRPGYSCSCPGWALTALCMRTSSSTRWWVRSCSTCASSDRSMSHSCYVKVAVITSPCRLANGATKWHKWTAALIKNKQKVSTMFYVVIYLCLSTDWISVLKIYDIYECLFTNMKYYLIFEFLNLKAIILPKCFDVINIRS